MYMYIYMYSIYIFLKLDSFGCSFNIFRPILGFMLLYWPRFTFHGSGQERPAENAVLRALLDLQKEKTQLNKAICGVQPTNSRI